jgi:hypothetical protein
VLMSALHELSRSETVRSEIAVIALAAVMGSLACATGVLWSSPNVIATLRALVDDLERRRSTQAEPPLLRTLREFFEAARPTMAQ